MKNNSQLQESKYNIVLALWQLDLERTYNRDKLMYHNLISSLEGLWCGDDTFNINTFNKYF